MYRCALGLVVALTAAPTIQAATFPYELTFLEDLPDGGATRAADINDFGQVVGKTYVGWNYRPFLWQEGEGMVVLDDRPGVENAYVGEANGINNSGLIVGRSGNHAFLWDEGRGMIDLGVLPGSNGRSTATSINDSNQVVGYSGSRAFLWQESSGMTDLGTLTGHYGSYAQGINNAGEIVGTSVSDHSHLFLWHEANGMTDPNVALGRGISRVKAINNSGQVLANYDGDGAFILQEGNSRIWLGKLKGAQGNSYATDINDAGQVVGSSQYRYGGSREKRAFLWQAGFGMVDLNNQVNPALGYTLRRANGINSHGQIIAEAYDGYNLRTALLTPTGLAIIPPPIPLPAGLPLMLTSLSGIVLLRLRRRRNAQQVSKRALHPHFH